MGRRPGDAEGGRTGLVEDDAGDLRQLAADLVDQELACLGMQPAAGLARREQRLDSGGGRADELRGALVEAAASGIAGIVPRRRDRVILVRHIA